MTTFFFFLKVGKNDLPNIIFFFSIFGKLFAIVGAKHILKLEVKFFLLAILSHPIWLVVIPFLPFIGFEFNSTPTRMEKFWLWTRLEISCPKPWCGNWNDHLCIVLIRQHILMSVVPLDFRGQQHPPPSTHDILYGQKAQSKRMWVILQVKSLYHFLNLHICM